MKIASWSQRYIPDSCGMLDKNNIWYLRFCSYIFKCQSVNELIFIYEPYLWEKVTYYQELNKNGKMWEYDLYLPFNVIIQAIFRI